VYSWLYKKVRIRIPEVERWLSHKRSIAWGRISVNSSFEIENRVLPARVGGYHKS